MSYRDNVRAAAAALVRGEDANWELARLTFESTLDARGSWDDQERANKVRMEVWCEDVRTECGRKRWGVQTGHIYKSVWRHYGSLPLMERPEWTEAVQALKGQTPETMAGASLRHSLSRALPEDKREAFARLAQDPDVVSHAVTAATVVKEIAQSNQPALEAAWKDTDTNIRLSTARVNAREELLEPQREAIRDTREIFEPKDATLDRRIFLADIATKVEQWTRELNGIRDFLAYSEDVDRVRRWATRQALDRLVQAAIACRDVLPSSSVSVPDDEPTVPAVRQRRGA